MPLKSIFVSTLAVVAFLSLFSCKSNTRKVIVEHFQADSLKMNAAAFVYDNMKGHYTIHSEAKDSVIKCISNSHTAVEQNKVEEWWTRFHWKDRQTQIPDSCVLTVNQIIQNVEEAFGVWQEVSWRNEVTFDTFCRFVLPYRVLTENLSSNWRSVLFDEYKSFISPDMTLKEAFLAIHEAIYKRIQKTKAIDFPYLLNPIEFEKVNKGECLQCCLYECYVMRAMCIPVAIDGISHWANYGTGSHSWVSLMTSDGKYTIDRYSKKVGKDNTIDATTFKIDSLIEGEYPYRLNFTKKCSKVRRVTFESLPISYSDDEAFSDTKAFFSQIHMKDVSSEYGLTRAISVNVNCQNSYAYLCTYRTGAGWTPTDYAKNTNNKYIFNNIGDSIIYLPMVFSDGVLKPIAHPIQLGNGKPKVLHPDTAHKNTVIIDRKYPLVGHFPDIWTNMKGAIIEASNASDFGNSDMLHVVSYTPIFRNVINVNKQKKYRYVRLRMPSKGNIPLAELEVFNNKGRLLSGKTFGTYAEKLDRCCDRDYFTCLEKVQNGYTFGIDLGSSSFIGTIIFFLKNDGNFVIPGDEYELFYYNMEWVSCGRKTAKKFSIEYNNVPKNALLLLKNVSQGTEERIFTYENHEQVWW